MHASAKIKAARSASEDWLWSHSNLIAALIVAVAFVIRLKMAAQSFLNGDEALHFMAANQPSWALTYEASLTVSHPPLLIFFLHVWRFLGTSELVLRLPCVLAGTVFCWIFFRWLSDLFGSDTGLIGIFFAGFLPPMLSLSTEIRQYAFLLFFAIAAMYWLERTLKQNSAVSMSLFSICLWLAIFSHYSAVLLAASLGLYVLLRMRGAGLSPAVIGIWVAAQIGALLLCAFLYFKYISAFGGQALHGWMDVYLHNSYFDPKRHHAIAFIFARTISVFQYVFGQNVVGDLLFLVFVAGIVFIWRRKAIATRGAIIFLLLFPFAITCTTALLDVYPYGGTRHCIFLAIFGIAAISFAFVRLVGLRSGLAIAALVVIVCNFLPSRRLPYIAPADQKRAHMDQAMTFIQKTIPPSDLIFVDSQTSLLLGHYLCRQQPFFIDEWKRGFNRLQCDGRQIIGTEGSVYTFTADNFIPSWNEMPAHYDLKPGTPVWIIQAGWLWEDSLGKELRERFPELRNLQVNSFGNNISIFKLTVDPALPLHPAAPTAQTTMLQSPKE